MSKNTYKGLLQVSPYFFAVYLNKITHGAQHIKNRHSEVWPPASKIRYGLLKDCGIDMKNGGNKLKTEADNFPLEIYFLRDDDIPQYVEDQVADIGIVGENVLYEKNKTHRSGGKTGFGKCRLSIAVGRSERYNDLTYLEGKKIATSYPQ